MRAGFFFAVGICEFEQGRVEDIFNQSSFSAAAYAGDNGKCIERKFNINILFSESKLNFKVVVMAQSINYKLNNYKY